MNKEKSKNHLKLALAILAWGFIFVSQIHADSEIKMWKSQTVYVPIYAHVYWLGDDRITQGLSINLIIRNTDPTNSITISAWDYFESDGKLLKRFLDSSVELTPMSSTNLLIPKAENKGGLGATIIVKWEAAKPVTEPLIEAIHSGLRGTASTSFIIKGKPIKGVYE